MEAVRDTNGKVIKRCSRCGTRLTRYNPGTLCFVCQRKESERLATGDRPYCDVEDMSGILGLGGEQVRRLGRKGRLPPRIPAVRRWLWRKEVVEQWIESEGVLPEGFAERLAALEDIHGDAHFDDINGKWKVGRPEVVSPIVSDHSGSKTVVYTAVMSEHSESP
ncbi:MAG: helix-turn-helix domain-containing protein [Dehalococcoidia bacterium]|nr:helix-turn-helix domain-containing protein [Dehalococcoidia bacterium]